MASTRKLVKKAGTTRKAATKRGGATTSDATTHGATTTLAQFLASTGTLSAAERSTIVDQAEVMLQALYVHLPLKRSMHATDPVQRLKLLRFHLAELSERQFHDEMIDIFVDLRDLHTNYILPSLYATKTAFLPFLLEEFFEGGMRTYLVSKMLAGFTHPTFKPGVVVTRWSGVPIDRAVEVNADRQAGSNPDARHARGLEALTIRAMAMSSPPDENWVIVGYLDGTRRARASRRLAGVRARRRAGQWRRWGRAGARKSRPGPAHRTRSPREEGAVQPASNGHRASGRAEHERAAGLQSGGHQHDA